MPCPTASIRACWYLPALLLSIQPPPCPACACLSVCHCLTFATAHTAFPPLCLPVIRFFSSPPSFFLLPLRYV